MTWTIEDGADAFPTDNTQWSDWDEDGFGDNYGNLSWTDRSENWPGEYYQYARDQDACPTLPGNSWQEDILGCPDRDGDGWADFMDAFPANPDEYLDSDKDGIADGNDDCPTRKWKLNNRRCRVAQTMMEMVGVTQKRVQIGSRLIQLNGQTLTEMAMVTIQLEQVQIHVLMKQDSHSKATFLVV